MMQTKKAPCMGAARESAATQGGTGIAYEELLAGAGSAAQTGLVPRSGQFQATPDKIEEVQTVDQMVYNSWKGMLARNIGREVIVSFLVGTRDTVVASGSLQEVGNDYITLYHAGRGSYLTADLYAIRFVEFPRSGGDVG